MNSWKEEPLSLQLFFNQQMVKESFSEMPIKDRITEITDMGKISSGPWDPLTEITADIITGSAPLADGSQVPSGRVKWEPGGFSITMILQKSS